MSSRHDHGSDHRVCALIVTYNPDPELLRRILHGILPQVDRVLIVDNGSKEPFQPYRDRSEASLETLLLGRNLGLAMAQNLGAEWARERDFSHMLLLDQDSLAEVGMVGALLTGLRGLQAQGVRVAAVGPVYTDPRTGMSRHFVRFPGLRVQREACDGARSLIPVDFLIASGTLLPLESIERIGPFEEALFIDNIDLEWSFRARDLGYRLYGVCAARMHHFLGDYTARIWLGRWWLIYRHDPVRQYYMARNRIVLYRRPYSPRGWILQDQLRFLAKLFWFGLVFPPRLANLRMILRGTADGLRGRLGPYGGD